MKITCLPKTNSGKWSVILMVLNWILFIVCSVLPWKNGYSDFEIFTQNPLQGVLTIIMFAVGIATFCMALISVIKKKERAILVFLAILYGFYSILGLFGSLATVFFG